MDKEHILSEIRRTTKVNGDKPLGSRRFFNETGIKDSDWLGKYWARWNDALKEAGYNPNQLQTAYPEELLLKRYIELMRELGKFPVKSELKMKVRSDQTFSSCDSIHRRFRSKQRLVEKLLEYCHKLTGYEDIIQLCEGIAKPRRQAALRSKEADVEKGSVYLIRSGRYYKIGRSNSAGRREYELTIQLPEKANTVHTIRTDDPAGIEAYWHKRYEAKRKNGEWFDLSSAEISAFKRRKFM